ncbi:hypothetical protein H696_02489 [Fonticula alba]|uniref:Uncharacterized protein n=1 Tax=Fonticula alba TaxID=691883 RepID=A0A058ZAX5_FONAL|nr:hypothetical protein H696_02489 [Fonticula alba]KCV71549.1 hypothetical protein H696_02489 [Fonticula alba]|eukprot:XP_009494672.1 hypothetical protein H696_02489 [Fonticula alba]
MFALRAVSTSFKQAGNRLMAPAFARAFSQSSSEQDSDFRSDNDLDGGESDPQRLMPEDRIPAPLLTEEMLMERPEFAAAPLSFSARSHVLHYLSRKHKIASGGEPTTGLGSDGAIKSLLTPHPVPLYTLRNNLNPETIDKIRHLRSLDPARFTQRRLGVMFGLPSIIIGMIAPVPKTGRQLRKISREAEARGRGYLPRTLRIIRRERERALAADFSQNGL